MSEQLNTTVIEQRITELENVRRLSGNALALIADGKYQVNFLSEVQKVMNWLEAIFNDAGNTQAQLRSLLPVSPVPTPPVTGEGGDITDNHSVQVPASAKVNLEALTESPSTPTMVVPQAQA